MTKLIKFFFLACCMFSLNISQSVFAQTTPEIVQGNCKACIQACQKTLDYCAKKGGKYNEASVTNAIKDCISACQQTDDLLNRNSIALEHKSCITTVDAATNCAKACDKFPGDAQMGSCANECRKCASNCSKVNTGGNNSGNNSGNNNTGGNK